MDRRETLLSLFDSSGFGLEIGPSYNPFLPKRDGYSVETFDHADAETLRKKYSDNASQIEEVTYVSDGKSLLDVIGSSSKYDFIFASHVIEHVTDIVRFLQDCSKLLRPNGVIVLAVPDKRFCFDRFRPISTVGQALQSYIEKRTRHYSGIIFDNASMNSNRNGHIVWVEQDIDNLQLSTDANNAHSTFKTSLSSDHYLDAHGWVFTPTSFKYIIKTIRNLNYTNLGINRLITNDGDIHRHEFYVSLSPDAPNCTELDIDLLKTIEEELNDVFENNKIIEGYKMMDKKSKETILSLRAEISELKMERDSFASSTSWKLTAPLRAIKRAITRC